MYILYAVIIMKLVGLGLYLLFQVWCHRSHKLKTQQKTEQENVDLLLTGLLKEEVHFQFTEEFIDSMENAKNKFSDLVNNIRYNAIPAINKISVEINDAFKKALAEEFGRSTINSNNHQAHTYKDNKPTRLPITSFHINKETDKDDRP